MLRLRFGAVALAAVLWAIGGTFARTLLDRGASPVELTAARAWIAFAGVGLIVVLKRNGPIAKRPSAPASLIIAFGLSLAAANFLYYTAIGLLPVAIAIVVQYTAPGLVVLWLAFSERRSPSRRVLVSLTCALIGVLALSELTKVVSTGDLGVSGPGLLAAFGSAIAFATYMVLGESMGRRFGADRAVLRGFTVASLFWVAVIAFGGRPDTLLTLDFLPGILFLGVAATIAPFLLFIWGLQQVKPSAAGIISTLEPVTAAALAYLWLGQRLTPVQWLGAALIIGSIALVQSESPQPVETMATRSAAES